MGISVFGRPVAWAGLSLLLWTVSAYAQTDPKSICIIHSYGANASPHHALTSAFQTALVRNLGEAVDFFETALDFDRFSTPDMQAVQVEFLQKRFAGRHLDLIVSIGGPAAQFVQKYRDRAFPGTPVLFLAADRRMVAADSIGANATLLTHELNLVNAIEDILQMAPDTTNVVVLFGGSSGERFWEEQLRREFRAFEDRVTFSYHSDLSLDEMEELVAALPPHSFIFVGLLLRDVRGITYDGYAPLQRLRAAANAPIYGYFNSQMGLGIVGGRLYQDQTLGTQGAEVAVRILRGKPAANIPPRTLQNPSPVYDWRELRRWGIKESRLPAGSSILFREPTFWQLYRWWVVGIILFSLIQTTLIIGLLTNLVTRRRTEQSLRLSEERYRRLFEADSDALLVTDFQNGRIHDANPAAVKLYGYTREEFSRLTAHDISAEPEKTERAMAAGTTYVPVRWHRRKDGTTFPVEISFGPLMETGAGWHIAAIRDITERVRAEKMLRDSESEARSLREELALFSRRATVGELTASLAHELNQPLAAILSNAQAALRLIERGHPDLKELHEIFDDVVADDRRAAEVIHSVRSMFRKNAAEQQPLDFNSLIQNILPLVRNDALVRHVLIDLELDSSPPSIKGNRVQLQQVILNLVVNALEAMHTSAGSHRLVLRTRQTDGEVVLDVTDSGTGILPDRLNSIFDPFFTTKPTGLGMGLPLSRSIMIAHNGRLWAENNPGGGATFHMALPVEQSLRHDPTGRADGGSQSDAAPHGLTVLVADDRETFRQAAASMLVDLPELKLLAEAADGAEAVEKAAELKPALILLDVNLPTINGVEAATRIRAAAPDAKILFLTQYDSPEFVRAALKTGALGYVLKVDAGSELVTASKAVLRGELYLSSGVTR